MNRSLLVGALLLSLGRLAHADEPKLSCRELAPDAKVTVEFKSDVSLADFSVWVASFTCKAVLYDSAVTQHVTKVHVLAPKPLTPKQALQLFVDAVGAAGLVVEQKADSIIIKRDPKTPQACPEVTAPVPTPPDPVDAEIDTAIKDGIIVVDDTHRTIHPALLDKVLANPMAISKGARVVPSVHDGKPDGFKLYAIRPASIYARLGFQNGDTLNTVNGFDLTSADKALEVYTKIREATSLQVDITRRGKKLSLFFTIK